MSQRLRDAVGYSLFVASLVGFTVGETCRAEEGMFPISELARLSLDEKGLSISAQDIFNPNAPSLIDGICRVNGCTGSFVSDQGLIITNHHCAYEAIQKASTPEKDLLANGFVATSQNTEVPAPGYVVRITESYRDVSEEVLASISPDQNATERALAIEKRRKELEQAAEVAHPGLRAEVAEMFLGKTYVLFLYTYLKDVRLVFAPPESIGAFGGDTDNWEWPRHTGDFAFMRAYTAPDGSSADYSSENVPYRPKRPISINPSGVNQGDFIFILGYPGRTLRQRTASYFEFEKSIRLPTIVKSYQWQMAKMEKAWTDDRDVAIKLISRYKSLANVEKRSRGQIQGLKRAKLVDQRASYEASLMDFIGQSEARKEKYGSLLSEIDTIYDDLSRVAPMEFAADELRTACRALAFAFTIVDASNELQKEELDRESAYMPRNLPLTQSQLKLAIADWVPGTDAQMLDQALSNLSRLQREQISLPEEIADWLQTMDASQGSTTEWFTRSQLGSPEFAISAMSKHPAELRELGDPFIDAMLKIYPAYLRMREESKARESRLGDLYRELQDVRMEFAQSMTDQPFVPDANATLRLTYGYVEGDRPADAIERRPITTFQGVLEKTTGHEPFITPKIAVDSYLSGTHKQFASQEVGDLPVCILYSADTTGGNSGSPVLNSRGELVAVNFDRTFEATINDFAWNENYSRSIGVDIRYVLWITGEVYGAKYLLAEMEADKD